MMDAILETLVRSPRFFEYLDRLKEIAHEEGVRRGRFYEALSTDEAAEFINGEVIPRTPTTHRHNDIRENIALLIGPYVSLHELGWAGGSSVLCCFTRNDYEPDYVFFGAAKAAKLEPTQLKHPVPDLVVEVLSPATRRHDRETKYADYAAHGVDEYWIVDPETETVEQHLLGPDGYTLTAKQADGTIHSRAISGFTLPVRAAFSQEENLRALQAILTRP